MRFGKDTYDNHSAEKKESVKSYWDNLGELRSKIFRRCTKHFLKTMTRDKYNYKDIEEDE